MNINRLWCLAVAALVAAVYVANRPAVAQVSPDLQERCARQAETVFHEGGYSKDITKPKGDESDSYDVIANFDSHYNTRLSKCFMILEIFGVGISNVGFQIRSLLDPFEGRIYAEWLMHEGPVLPNIVTR